MAMITAGGATVFIKGMTNIDAIPTVEGLLVIDWAIIKPGFMGDVQTDYSDTAFEEPHVFPIVNGMVDITPIKQWLGY